MAFVSTFFASRSTVSEKRGCASGTVASCSAAGSLWLVEDGDDPAKPNVRAPPGVKSTGFFAGTWVGTWVGSLVALLVAHTDWAASLNTELPAKGTELCACL